ncbi:MAG: hypothetical protein ABF747_00785 [Bifidobacterium sp.]|uniref:DUF3892 domain-containing protein n=1 Tax=Bifidobacterium fermentum TaxID=3059035 RepID=A0AB39UP10_9BIFI
MEGILIKYNRKNGERIVHEFKGDDGYLEAMQTKTFLESISQPQADWEVVVIGSDSIATVERTHSRYFSGRDVTSDYADVKYVYRTAGKPSIS